MSLAKRIVEVAHAVNTKLRPIIKAQQLKESLGDSNCGSHSLMSLPLLSERTGKEEKVETDQFVVLLKEFRFKEVKEFKMHHYWNQAKEEKGAINRTYMRRLQHEYADLSKVSPSASAAPTSDLPIVCILCSHCPSSKTRQSSCVFKKGTCH